MPYALAADLVLVAHGLFIAFVVFGGLLALWRPYWLWLHLPALAWGVIVEAFGFVCPLTPLENRLRRLAGDSGYSDGFIEHYLWPLIYPDGLTRQHQLVLACLLIAFNIGVYIAVFRRRRRIESR